MLKFIVSIIFVSVIGCPSARTSDDRQKVPQAEIQEDIQRLASIFIERVTQSIEKLNVDQGKKNQQALLRQLLRYGSSALDIAAGPYPEVNLLDMIVFLRLDRESLETRGIPDVPKADIRVLLGDFLNSEDDLARIADKVSSSAQQQAVYDLIETWRKENPDQIHVEWVRLSDFSKRAGKLETKRAQEASGLLAGVKSAASAANQALLLGNRAMFLGQRMPFLLRLQARIGTQEVLSDSLRRLDQSDDVLEQTQPLVKDLAVITTQLKALADRASPLMADVRKYFPRDSSSTLTQKLSMGEKISDNLVQMVSALNRVPISSAKNQAEALIWTLAQALIIVGAAWTLFWWGGYFLVKRILLHPAAKAVPKTAKKTAA